jgi:hypothetical protein
MVPIYRRSWRRVVKSILCPVRHLRKGAQNTTRMMVITKAPPLYMGRSVRLAGRTHTRKPKACGCHPGNFLYRWVARPFVRVPNDIGRVSDPPVAERNPTHNLTWNLLKMKKQTHFHVIARMIYHSGAGAPDDSIHERRGASPLWPGIDACLHRCSIQSRRSGARRRRALATTSFLPSFSKFPCRQHTCITSVPISQECDCGPALPILHCVVTRDRRGRGGTNWAGQNGRRRD